LTTNHSVILRGLSPARAYFFRVRSLDSSGRVAISSNGSFTTRPRGQVVGVDEVVARRVTATTALLEWSASTAVAQVEYGRTPTYGQSTLLRSYPSTQQDMLLTGLRPLTRYHFRIRTWNGAGSASVSDDYTFTTAPAQNAMLLGDRDLHPAREILAAGQLMAVQFAAQSSGLASAVPLYVDAASTASSAAVGIYADRGGRPGALLTQATLIRPAPGGWNRIGVRPTSLVQGTTYWLVVLNPGSGSGSLVLRGGPGPNSSLVSAPRMHGALPLTWVSEVPPRPSTLSAYVQQMVPAVTVTGPSEGSSVSGNVSISAVVDGDLPVSGVQFFVDGEAVGAIDRAAPYSLVWNSAGTTTRDFHTFSARADDASGRVGMAAPVAAYVDNGAVISASAEAP
jgi:hypothetical protein